MYEFLRTAPLAPAPDWLWKLCENGENDHAASTVTAGEVIPEGRRDATLTSMAGHMRRAGFGEDEMVAALEVVSRNRCVPPLDEVDIRKVARSVARYAPDPLANVTITGVGKAARLNADTSDDPLDSDATALDLIKHNATIRWVWEKWIPLGVLTILASEPGVGKTRFCCDLARRIYRGQSWPDGQSQSLPERSTTLWVPADNQHPELGTLPGQFDFPAAGLYLNATRRNPFAGTMLDSLEDLVDFEARVARIKPALVFVDTCLNATDRTSHKPEDAKAFFVPLAQIAQRQQVALVCVTHLNAAGKPLGRRIQGQGRVVIQLEHPDPENQPNRRKLHVVKSHSLFPTALGVTMHDRGNDYDTNPPAVVEKPGRSAHLVADCQWLSTYLGCTPKRVSHTREDAERTGISAPRLYRAKQELGVEQFEAEGKKWWQVTAKDDE